MAYEVVELVINSQAETLLDMIAEHKEEAFPYLAYYPEKVRFVVNRVMEDIDRETYNIYLCYKDQELIGYCYCTQGEYLFSLQHFASLEMVYVKPAYRGSRAFLKLVKAFEEWGRLRGCIEYQAGVSIDNEDKAEKISNALVKVGYQRFGFVQKKRVN